MKRKFLFNWVWAAVSSLALLLTIGKTSPNDPRWTTPPAVKVK